MTGSIPACAGETERASGGTGADQVHPRVCGGNRTCQRRNRRGSGPSPRVRGKLLSVRSVLPRLRSIPACAGETPRSQAARAGRWVHPRVCGGNSGRQRFVTPISGPSPRVRGKPGSTYHQTLQKGSIPACAGETVPRFAPCRWSEVHPRVCGETGRGNDWDILPWVHPRVCGGNRAPHIIKRFRKGPSPRVRGKLFLDSLPCRWSEVHPRVCGGNRQG